MRWIVAASQYPLRPDKHTLCCRWPTFHVVAPFSFSSKPVTTSTTLRKPSISSSTVPPIPALAKLMELPTYTGFPVFRASSFDSLVVKSSVLPCVKSGVLRGSAGEALCSYQLAVFLQAYECIRQPFPSLWKILVTYIWHRVHK